MARQLDRSRPFAEVIGVGFHHVYEQDGKCFDRDGNECPYHETGVGQDAPVRDAVQHANTIVAKAKESAAEILAKVREEAAEILAAARAAVTPPQGDAAEPEIKKAAGGKK